MNKVNNIKLTKEQLEVVNTNKKNIVIQALAGTGKTTTLVEYAKMHPETRFLYLAFNKAIAEEAKTKFSQNVEVRTVHSIAYEWFFNTCVSKTKGKKKNAAIIRVKEYQDFFASKNIKVGYFEIKSIDKIISGYCSSNEYKMDEYIAKCTSSGVDFYSKACKTVFSDFIDVDGVLPITHDVYLKLFQIYDIKIAMTYNPNSCILFDESQDSNDVMTAIVLNQDCKKIFIGDKHQSIYQFRGAKDALTGFEKKADAVLSLTQTFRYGDNLAKFASKILSVYKEESRTIKGLERDTNIFVNKVTLGEVDYLNSVVHEVVEIKQEPLCLISRINKPIVELSRKLAKLASYSELQNPKLEYNKFFFNGDLSKYKFDLDKEMFEMVSRASDEFIEYWKGVDSKASISKNKNNKFNKYKELKDFDSLERLVEYVTSVEKISEKLAAEDEIVQSYKRIEEDIEAKINTITLIELILAEHKRNKKAYESGELKNPIILTTAHVSKGLEWDNVFIFDNLFSRSKFVIDSPFDLKKLQEKVVKVFNDDEISEKIHPDSNIKFTTLGELDSNFLYSLEVLYFIYKYLDYHMAYNFLDELNLRINLIYVALTRAKKNIYVPFSCHNFMFAFSDQNKKNWFLCNEKVFNEVSAEDKAKDLLDNNE